MTERFLRSLGATVLYLLLAGMLLFFFSQHFYVPYRGMQHPTWGVVIARWISAAGTAALAPVFAPPVLLLLAVFPQTGGGVPGGITRALESLLFGWSAVAVFAYARTRRGLHAWAGACSALALAAAANLCIMDGPAGWELIGGRLTLAKSLLVGFAAAGSYWMLRGLPRQAETMPSGRHSDHVGR